MKTEIERKINAILKIIANSKDPVGSKEISKRLKGFGIDLTERSVRYHLKIMDQRGLTEGKWKAGRVITKKGRDELDNALVSSKVGLIFSKIETMAYQMDFDLMKRKGRIILNISFIPKEKITTAFNIMAEVFDHDLNMGELVAIANEGEELGGVDVPAGKIALGTLCSVNLNGILLKESIPVESKFAGVLQVEEKLPRRFTDLVYYSGSTLEPLEIFIKSKMTSIRSVIATGSGKVMAGFREIPAVSRDKAEAVLNLAEKAGLGSAWIIGKPSQPLLGIPVGQERVGIVLLGGLNPIAAVEEVGIETESKALTALVDYKRLKSFWDVI